MSSSKSFGTSVEAEKFYSKTVAEKLKKGYVANNTTTSSAPAATTGSISTSAVAAGATATASSKSTAASVSASKPAAVATGHSTYLVCREGGSDKFYEIRCGDGEVFMRYGKNGTEVSNIGRYVVATLVCFVWCCVVCIV